MRPYPAYKESGVEWLGAVPEGWETPQIKRFARLVYGDALASEVREADGEVLVYGSNGPVGRHNVSNTRSPAILIGRKGSYGALNWADTPCFAIDTVYFIDPASAICELRWLYWALHTANLDANSQDTGVPGLSRDDAHATHIPLPPLPEQQAIARFLDKEVAKIDALVAEQRRLIALLAEKRQAVISHAVTKGLNPATPLKPSGIDWLGDIPEGWEVVPLRRLVTLNPSKSEVADRSREEEVSFLPMEAVGQDGSLDLSRTRPIGEVETGYTYLREGDVAFAKITPCFENGKGALMRGLVGGIAFGTTELTVLRPSDESLSQTFLACVVSSPLFLRLGEGHMYGAGGQKRVPDDFAREFRIALPSRAEQDSIVEHIKATHERFDALTTAATSAISLLQERRAALISAAVTGKIDLRPHFAQSLSEPETA